MYFGCHNDRFGGNGSILSINDSETYGTRHQYGISHGVLKEEAVEMFRRFYAQTNCGAPAPKRRKKAETEEGYIADAQS